MRKAKQKCLDGFKALGVVSRKSTKSVENDEKTPSKTRSPLKTQSKNIPEDKMRPCRVVLDRMPKASAKTTVKTTSPEQTDMKNRAKIYDYSFDADKTNDEDKNSDQLQDFFKKLADEKKITLKKYKSKAVKNKIDKKTVDARKKPRNERQQQVKTEHRKPNLNQMNDKQLRTAVQRLEVDSNKNVVGKVTSAGDIGSIEKNKETNIAFDEKSSTPGNNNSLTVDSANKALLRHRPTHQSTPISTPLRRTRSSTQHPTKSTSVLSNITSPCPSIDDSSVDFDSNFDIDPLPEPTTEEVQSAVPLRQSPRKSIQSASTSSTNKENSIFIVENTLNNTQSLLAGTSKESSSIVKSPRKSPRKSVHFAASTSSNKENLVLTSEKPSRDSAISALEKPPRKAPSPIPGTSKDFEYSILSVEKTPMKSLTTSINHCSVLSSSPREKSIFPVKTYSFSPKKQFGRTPLKTIRSDNSAFSLTKIDLSDLSNKSNTMTSNKTFNPSIDLVLAGDVEELPSLFEPDNASDDSRSKFTKDNCFGFDFDDDDDVDDLAVPNSKTSLKTPLKKNTKKKSDADETVGSQHMLELRQKLKQFLNNPMTPVKKGAKVKTKRATPSKSVPCYESPEPSTSWAPPQSTPKMFSDARNYQKDIRSVFSGVDKQKADGKNKNKANREPSPLLFEEMETVHDHRKSYSRPVKQYQKRRISVDSGSESEHDEAESHKKTRKIKRKKLVEAPEDKDKVELEKFAEKLNTEFGEIDKYELKTQKE